MIIEVYIENRRLDIYSDISSLLTFALDDIKDFAKRSTTFSKTIIIPGTANNNTLFGNIFAIGISNGYDSTLNNVGYNFNAAKSARCIIFQDNFQTFKGTLRLLEITKVKGQIEYEVALNGELTGLNVALSSAFLDDLDFSAYNLSFTYGNVVGSWDNPPGSGVYFPMIDYGTYSTLKHDWDIRTFRPALYAKEYIDKMFAAAGYSYVCDLFNTARFKGLIIPHNQKKITSLTNFLFSATRTGSSHIIDNSTVYTVPIPFTVVIGTPFTPSAGNTKFTYNLPTSQNIHVTASASGKYVGQTTAFTLEIRLNGITVPGTQQTFPATGTTSEQFYSYGKSFDVTINQNDYLQLVATSPIISNGDYLIVSSAGIGATTLVPTQVEIGYGDNIEINNTIPKNIRQVDFLTSIVKLFNLYVYEDQFNEKQILISPFVDFYDGSVVDWTYKLNRDQPIKVKPMSEINSKYYQFNYKADTDFYNDLYSKRYNQGYGSYIYDTEFEFVSQTSSLDLIFAPTPIVGYVGEDKKYSTIFKRTGSDSAPTEENTDSVIRILQTKKKTVSSWNIKDGTTVLGSSTVYGYAGHYDDPDDIDNDLNFGALREIFFTLGSNNLANTQFNIYWSAYMAEITDKDSKLLTAKFYLTTKDIFDLKFSRYVMVDGVLFRLNKIVDYNATVPGDCTVELITVINSSYTFPPISAGGSDFFLLWNDLSPLADFDSQNMLFK